MIDEQVATKAFEELCGSVERAQQLFRIFKDSYPMPGQWMEQLPKRVVFRRRALFTGFTEQEIEALLDLQ